MLCQPTTCTHRLWPGSHHGTQCNWRPHLIIIIVTIIISPLFYFCQRPPTATTTPYVATPRARQPFPCPPPVLMASSEVDQKFLGKLAKEVELENPLLSSKLFKILGLSINLSEHLVKARKQRKLEPDKANDAQPLHLHILWLAREGLNMLERYVLPMVGNSGVLKVLAFKLRASFYHIFVLFHNQPPVTTRFLSTPDLASSSTAGPSFAAPRVDKGKGIARDDDWDPQGPYRPRGPYEGGAVAPPPGFGPEPPGAFLLPVADYLPTAHKFFRDAAALADSTLWGSHSLRLSVKTEYSAFLYECAHDEDASRALARQTINEVYEATEGIDNDMFQDACELVTVLGRMMKRGQPSSNKASSTGTVQKEATPPRAGTQPEGATSIPVTEAQPGFI